jgi:ubiquinone/menaquinone biosynthesis C-methylase UbiE
MKLATENQFYDVEFVESFDEKKLLFPKKYRGETFEREYYSLNVGCGTVPSGDVNLDLFKGETYHRARDGIGKSLEVNKIKNFITATGYSLPFPNNSFPLVVSNHVIEHLDYPVKFLNELLRVSSHKVLIHCPHKWADRIWKPYKEHKGYFNRTWFHLVAEKLKVYCVTRISKELQLPSSVFHFSSLPLEIEAEFFK